MGWQTLTSGPNWPMPGFVNKVLLVHKHTCSLGVDCGCFHTIIVEPSSDNRNHIAHKAWNIYCSAHSRKSLLTLWPRSTTFSLLPDSSLPLLPEWLGRLLGMLCWHSLSSHLHRLFPFEQSSNIIVISSLFKKSPWKAKEEGGDLLYIYHCHLLLPAQKLLWSLPTE